MKGERTYKVKGERLKVKGWIFLSIFIFQFSIFLCLSGCREYKVSNDPSLRLSFSCDTLFFDTVFTEQGSATAQIMVYNRNKSAVMIDHVWLSDCSYFRVNVDGEADLSRLHNLQINGGDSVFVFIRADINPTSQDTPLLISDKLHFHLTNDMTQGIVWRRTVKT